MTDTVRFDVTGLADLAQDLRGAGQRYSSRVPAVIKRGAQNIKTDAQRRVRASIRGRYLPHYARSITYDVGVVGGRVSADIGPEQSRSGGRIQGAFGPGVEFGSANHAPIPHLIPAFEAEVPVVEQQLQAAAIRAVLR